MTPSQNNSQVLQHLVQEVHNLVENTATPCWMKAIQILGGVGAFIGPIAASYAAYYAYKQFYKKNEEFENAVIELKKQNAIQQKNIDLLESLAKTQYQPKFINSNPNEWGTVTFSEFYITLTNVGEDAEDIELIKKDNFDNYEWMQSKFTTILKDKNLVIKADNLRFKNLSSKYRTNIVTDGQIPNEEFSFEIHYKDKLNNSYSQTIKRSSVPINGFFGAFLFDISLPVIKDTTPNLSTTL